MFSENFVKCTTGKKLFSSEFLNRKHEYYHTEINIIVISVFVQYTKIIKLK